MGGSGILLLRRIDQTLRRPSLLRDAPLPPTPALGILPPPGNEAKPRSLPSFPRLEIMRRSRLRGYVRDADGRVFNHFSSKSLGMSGCPSRKRSRLGKDSYPQNNSSPTKMLGTPKTPEASAWSVFCLRRA